MRQYDHSTTEPAVDRGSVKTRSDKPKPFVNAAWPLSSAVRLCLTVWAKFRFWRLCLLADKRSTASVRNHCLIGKAKPYRTGKRPIRKGELFYVRGRTLKAWLCVIAVVGPATFLPTSIDAFAQKRTRRSTNRPVATSPRTARPRVVPEVVDPQLLERAMGAICAARSRDPLGSSPIDEMQTSPSLELNHPKAVVGAQRARRLLPVARELVIEALRQLAVEYKFPLKLVRPAAARVRDVTEVTPDPDLRDNAAVIMNDPHTIRFGTIFLVGLPSDEGMMSVLAHELTHIADGRQNSLQGLFYQIGRRAARLTGLRINGQKPEELACDLVGVRAARFLISRSPSTEPLTQRLARTLEHNCVDDDDTDEEHLSPRSTMRAVLALEPTLARELTAREGHDIGYSQNRGLGRVAKHFSAAPPVNL